MSCVSPCISIKSYAGASQVVLVSELYKNYFAKHVDPQDTRNADTNPFTSQENSYQMEAVYAAGRVVCPSFLDALTCQAYFNPDIVMIFRKFINLDVSSVSTA